MEKTGLQKALEGITIDKKAEVIQVYMDELHARAEKRTAELTELLKTKVKYAIFTIDEHTEPCICYFKPVPTAVKMRCTDIGIQSPTRAAETLFKASLLPEHSDKRVLIQDNDNDEFYLVALDWCLENFKKGGVSVKKISQYLTEFENSERLQQIALIKFFFHKDMEKASELEIAKEWIQLAYCLKKGGTNMTMKE